MLKVYVDSSNLVWVNYNKATKVLTVSFKNGSVYEYYNVPEDIYNNLLDAPSKGSYHAKNIKYSFEYKKIGG